MQRLLVLGLTGVLVAAPVDAALLFAERFEAGSATTTFTLNTADVNGVAGTSGQNLWQINDVYVGGTGTLTCFGFQIPFTAGNTALQPPGISGSPDSNYLHITGSAASAQGINNANYVPADGTCIFSASHFARMSSDVNTAGMSNISLDFWWLCDCSEQSFGEVYYSLDSGLSWTPVIAPNFSGSATWQQAVLSMPEWDNQPTLRFGFRFRNEPGVNSANPSFGVDDVRIRTNPTEIFINGFEVEP